MQYLQSTKSLPLILEDDGNGIIQWWAESAFAVYSNMRSHTRGVLPLGGGGPPLVRN
jgi:hypothetical protein